MKNDNFHIKKCFHQKISLQKFWFEADEYYTHSLLIKVNKGHIESTYFLIEIWTGFESVGTL